MSYDSKADTQAHIDRVGDLLDMIRERLELRASMHDASKLASPEKEAFDAFTPRLATLEYDTDEYRQCLREMQVTLDHHYANNSHHPQHYADGINGMSLLDIVEMLADWKAAGERMANGSLEVSIQKNIVRYGISPQLAAIFENTRKELGW